MAWKIPLVLVLLLIVLQSGLTVASWRTPTLGVTKGSVSDAPRLLPCPGTPNCVCSQDASAEFWVEPLPFTGSALKAVERLKVLCTKLGFRLVQEEGRYLRYACVTPLMRYVDDLEFLLDEENSLIHVRSSSRVGRSDLGANRKRVERVRKLFQSAQE